MSGCPACCMRRSSVRAPSPARSSRSIVTQCCARRASSMLSRSPMASPCWRAPHGMRCGLRPPSPIIPPLCSTPPRRAASTARACGTVCAPPWTTTRERYRRVHRPASATTSPRRARRSPAPLGSSNGPTRSRSSRTPRSSRSAPPPWWRTAAPCSGRRRSSLTGPAMSWRWSRDCRGTAARCR